MLNTRTLRPLKEWAGWPKLAWASYVPVLAGWVSGYFGKLFWIFELASHFKPQYLLASAIFAPVFAFFGQRRWVQLALVCALSNGLHLAQFYIPARHAACDRPAGTT